MSEVFLPMASRSCWTVQIIQTSLFESIESTVEEQ